MRHERLAAMLLTACAVWAAVLLIQMDRYLIQAEERLQARNLAGAKEVLDRILELQREHGLEIPAVFHFRHAEVWPR